MKKITLVLSIAAILLSSCSKTIEGDLIIKNVNIIDVETGNIDNSMDVVIISDSIATILNHKKYTYKATQVIDGTDKFLTPGLWDMHTHTWWGYEELFPLLLANGITGIQEMFGDLIAVNNIKEKINSGEIIGPEFISAGRIIDGKPAIHEGSDEADTPEKGREIVRRHHKDGADFIKVYSLLKKEVYLAIADESKKLGLPMYGHLPDGVTLEEGIKASHKSLEHFIGVLEYSSSRRHHYHDVMEGKKKDTTILGKNTWIKILEFQVKTHDPKRLDSLIQLLANSNTWVNPTNVVDRAYAYQKDSNIYNNYVKQYMPHYLTEFWKRKSRSDHYYKAWQVHYKLRLSLINKMKDGGVKFLAGSDYGNPFVYPGFDLHKELEIFVDVGFTPLEALQTATINPAKFLNKTNELGTVAKGKIANLLLLAKNPLEDIKNTKAIAYVFQRGKGFSGETLRKSLDSIKSYNKRPKAYEELYTMVKDKGIEAALKRYHEIEANESNTYAFDESQLNLVANKLLKEKNYKDAITIYEYNNKLYPDYYFGYENLAEAHLEAGDTVKAIEVYKRAVKKNLSEKPLRSLEKLEKTNTD